MTTDTGSTKALLLALRAEAARNGGQGAYAWRSRELCRKAADAIEALSSPAPAEQGEVERLRELSERATKGPWGFDAEPNEDGEYGGGEDPGRGFDDYMILGGEGGKLAGTEDATWKSIEEEFDEDGDKAAWDTIGRANAEFIVAAVNYVRARLSRPSSEALPAGYVMVPREVADAYAQDEYCSCGGLVSSGAGMRDALAASAQAPASDKIPAGMKRWDGGDAAPDDWDENGLLALRGGGVSPVAGVIPYWVHEGHPNDIIAYTPASDKSGGE